MKVPGKTDKLFLVYQPKKMSESQTKAGNQEFQSLNVIENFENFQNIENDP